MQSIQSFIQSLRFKLLIGISIVVIPLVAILIFNNMYSIDVVRNQVAQSNKNLLSLYMQQIDRNLVEADNYLSNLSLQNTDLPLLEKEKDIDSFQYTKAILRLFNQINIDIEYYKTMDNFFIYSAVNDELIMTPSAESSFDKREAEKNGILSLLSEYSGSKSKSDNMRWHVKKIDQDYYLYRIVKVGNEYVGAWVNAKKLMVPLEYIDLGSTGAALLVTNDWQPMNNDDLILRENVQLRTDQASYYLTGNRNQYLTMSEASSKGEFGLVVLIADHTILERLPDLKWLIAVISGVAIAFLAVFLLFMRKEFLSPINRIIFAMRKLKDGNINPIANVSGTSSEFQIMNQSFNSMMQEIQDLKIHVYEEKLNLQKAELKQLQLQINPHFFLNSLNMIYNLAMSKNFEVIQEMAKCLVHYFRFMFRSKADFLKLHDEISHTRNYLRIQQLRFPEGLTYKVDCPERWRNCAVPPLIVQSLVENAIKHSVTMDETIAISVEVTESPEEGWIDIRIADTGNGFSEEVLDSLRKGDLVSEDDEKIGIWNLTRRMSLLYDRDDLVHFSNDADGGAVVHIHVPIHYLPEGV
ncbi:sensor histidine kinase [Cohnella sp. WQ 127256]|uniref:sensor histidine kinase n=1 Tax=Cohnella sp. WQ 127256 TaxID=2938790 RepID=UPI0021197950|nr:histidine kinase [Cohnella sp. WQ 127256]